MASSSSSGSVIRTSRRVQQRQRKQHEDNVDNSDRQQHQRRQPQQHLQQQRRQHQQPIRRTLPADDDHEHLLRPDLIHLEVMRPDEVEVIDDYFIAEGEVDDDDDQTLGSPGSYGAEGDVDDQIITYRSATDSNEASAYSISDRDLSRLSVRELNWVLRNHPKDVMKQVKEKRRLLKNRGYAQGTRVKLTELSEDLEIRKDELGKDIRNFKRANSKLEEQLRNLRAKRQRLEKALGDKRKLEKK